MTFISYAQNFEDVMLWRALKHVPHGFYIDIGAHSPDYDSVTKAFYESGWHGINVEPNPTCHDELQQQRPRDNNLRVAIGDQAGSMTMNFVSNPGLSTFDDEIASRHEQAGMVIDRQEVRVATLSMIWDECVPKGQDVHFLKIDVEGFEKAAIEGNNWQQNRPWIVVVESTLPMSQEETHQEWEHNLLNANYKFAYADGLNRYYVAAEKSELVASFKYPPNVFDDFIRLELHDALQRRDLAESRAVEAESQAQIMYNSFSWKITRPFRGIARICKKVFEYK